ncbi:hypothetical protein Q31a_42260 [Aureliella helgolandensis]|uniref:Uncharacterized protein n=1 Tax=Aureliella helgolandensis TaxID=2527968 RepID=A0A518GBC5_9BACT|nr:hypothetical protein Q31a_42260 [Aureliella helgolandensis]
MTGGKTPSVHTRNANPKTTMMFRQQRPICSVWFVLLCQAAEFRGFPCKNYYVAGNG